MEQTQYDPRSYFKGLNYIKIRTNAIQVSMLTMFNFGKRSCTISCEKGYYIALLYHSPMLGGGLGSR